MKIKAAFIKFFFLAVVLCLSLTKAFCQKPLAIYYLDQYGDAYQDQNGADYMLFILPSDTSVDKNLFVAKEYYLDGNLRFISGVKSINLQELYPKNPAFLKPALQGAYISYFHGGHKMEIASYEDGNPVGDYTLYYPNGKFYCVKTYIEDKPCLFKECRDSTGNVLLENGNGKAITFFDESFKNYLSGEVINGLPQGIWHGKQDDSTDIEGTYKDGELKLEAILEKGGQKTYLRLDTVPEFPGGANAFNLFLSRNIRYPAAARQANKQGRVIVTFTIDKDGHLSDFIIRRSVSKEIDDEAIRVVKISKWKPGMIDGEPVKVKYSVPISFRLASD